MRPPSAPDELSGSWWKYDVVRKVVQQQPGRQVVWVDDELCDDSEFTRQGPPPTGLATPRTDPARGLTTDNLEVIERWLDEGKTSCTSCGSVLVPVVYGYPSGETFTAAERGEVVLGGCVVWDGQPALGCPSCR